MVTLRLRHSLIVVDRGLPATAANLHQVDFVLGLAKREDGLIAERIVVLTAS